MGSVIALAAMSLYASQDQGLSLAQKISDSYTISTVEQHQARQLATYYWSTASRTCTNDLYGSVNSTANSKLKCDDAETRYNATNGIANVVAAGASLLIQALVWSLAVGCCILTIALCICWCSGCCCFRKCQYKKHKKSKPVTIVRVHKKHSHSSGSDKKKHKKHSKGSSS